MSSSSVLESIKDREFAYLLSNTRLRVNQNMTKLDIGSIHLGNMNQGDMVELPRWIAEVLTRLGLCEIQEESFSSELVRAVSREKIIGDNQLATLKADFYIRIRRYLAYSQQMAELKPAAVTELEKIRSSLYDLTALRLRKILMISSSLSPPPDLKEKLTPEEYQIFDSIFGLLRSWRSAIIEAH
jgi:DNA replication factor GINS